MFETKSGFFSDPTVVILSPERAQGFGLIFPSDKTKDSIQVIYQSVKETATQVQIKLQISFDSKSSKERTVVILKKDWKPSEKIGVAVAYLHKKTWTEKEKERATALLLEGNNGYNSYLPLYLLQERYLKRYENFDALEKRLLYEALLKPDTVPGFFWSVYVNERSTFKRAWIAKQGYLRFPLHMQISEIYASNLYREGKYEECIQVVQKVLTVNNSENNYTAYVQLVENAFDSYCLLERYEEAEELIQKSDFQISTKNLLFGILKYRQEKYSEAKDFFSKVIEEEIPESEESIAALYYTLACYQRVHDTKNIRLVLENLPAKHEWYLYPFRMEISDIAFEALHTSLGENLDELSLAKIKGYLGSLYENMLPLISSRGSRRKMTKEENDTLKKARKCLSEAIDFFPEFHIFNEAYSDVLYRFGNFDESFKYALKCIRDAEEGGSFCSVTLADCSPKVTDNYINFLNLNLSSENERFYVETYFDGDIGVLWGLKKYDVIAALYKKFKPYLSFKKAREDKKMMGQYYSDSLFEVAYSLAHQKERAEAIFVYEKHITVNGANSSTLNNLALLYEEDGTLVRAKTLITKAKRLTEGKDEIINNNYNRLINRSKKSPKQETRHERKVKGELTFNEGIGVIVYGKKECEIPLGTVQYYICQKLFQAELGTRVEEGEILSLYDSERGREEGTRTVSDARRAINKKVFQSLGIRDLIDYGAARVWIRKEALQ